jgi:hypothetical protein
MENEEPFDVKLAAENLAKAERRIALDLECLQDVRKIYEKLEKASKELPLDGEFTAVFRLRSYLAKRIGASNQFVTEAKKMIEEAQK